MGTTIFGILFGVFLIAAGLADINDENLASLTFWVDALLIFVGAVFLLGIAKFIGRKKK
ncbi:TPA: hypothetical protein PXM28_001629 [Yersinia enterocolitica]|nr:hypothetical protein [Yersinia enterocolitica]